MRPLNDSELPDSVAKLFAEAGPPLNIHRLLANHPDLLQAFWPLRGHIVKENTLPARQHELLILRIAYHTQAEYEWRHHVVRGRRAGLTDAEIERVRTESDQWTDADRLILQCADGIVADQRLDEQTAGQMVATFGNDGTLDAIFTAGIYLAIAAIVNSFDLPFDQN